MEFPRLSLRHNATVSGIIVTNSCPPHAYIIYIYIYICYIFIYMCMCVNILYINTRLYRLSFMHERHVCTRVTNMFVLCVYKCI